MTKQAGEAIDVRYIAQLARIELDDSSVEKLQKDMESIVGYINDLSELDVSGIEPTAHASVLSNVWREDVEGGSLGHAMLKNAPAVVNGDSIAVPRVLPSEEM